MFHQSSTYLSLTDFPISNLSYLESQADAMGTFSMSTLLLGNIDQASHL